MTNAAPQKKRPVKRHFKGVVVSAAQQKTIVVRVDHLRFHPIYQKRYTVSKKFQVHDAKQQCSVGETVEFEECRPISKHKKMRVIYPKQ